MADKRIQKAIDRLEKSLTPTWWVSPDELTVKDGHKVFDAEKAVVHELLNKDLQNNPDALALAQVIVGVDRSLAQNAIDNSTGVKPGVGKALDEMAKGDSDRTNGKYESAIDHYKHAWEKVAK